MDLLVVRHAIAEEVRRGLPDARRRLTRVGRQRMRRAVAGLQTAGLRLDRIHTSPWRRAVQTAELLAPLARRQGRAPLECTGLARRPDLALLAELRGVAAPSGSRRMTQHGRRDPDTQCVAVVGHEPWTGELVAWLVCGEQAGGSAFALKKGGVAWLRGTPKPKGMRLVAVFTPRVLRRLGRD